MSVAMPSKTHAIEAVTQRIGREIFERARRARPRPIELGWWQELGLAWSMRRPHLRDRLFRFISLLPRQVTHAEVARSLREHLGGNGDDLPFPLRLAVDFRADDSAHAQLVAWAARFAAGQMARGFIVGSTPAEAVAAVGRMRSSGMTFTLDVLGETVRTTSEAEHFHELYRLLLRELASVSPRWSHDPLLDSAPFGPLARANVSVKLSALSPHFTHDLPQIDTAEAFDRLLDLCRAARAGGGFINVDLEHVSLREATFEIFERLCCQSELRDWPDVGIVIQAYLRDSRNDFDRLLELARRRATPITVRLVKGAYWDYETALAAEQGRPSPVWSHKWESDAQFEELTRLLVEHADLLRPAFGSHNVRSLAHAIAAADAAGLPPRTIELQALYGMGDPLKTALVQMKQRLRVYCPMGAWVPGVAYLVRRLLENTANESFLRQSFLEGVDEDRLLAPPGAASAG